MSPLPEHPRSEVKRTVLQWLTIAMVAAGCTATSSAPTDGSTTETSPTAQPTASTAPTDRTVGAVDRAEMERDERAAVTAADTFWRRYFAQQGQAYQSPNVAGSYIGTHGPPCGGEPASVPFNAVYCRPGDFVAWDDDLMAAGYSQIGDAWVYLIIAHEWGHAIQARLRTDRVSVAAELQADCLAGAALQGASDEGVIDVEPGDSEEIARTLEAVADDYPWTNEGDHGNAQERTESFNAGVQGGVEACLT